MAPVPDFAGKSFEDALEVAQGAGFVLAIAAWEYSHEHEKDMVVSQSIPAGTEIMGGNTVELVVSLGIQVVRVADVQFRTEAEARARLEEQGLSVEVRYQASDTVAGGLVISQSPAAQAEAGPNGTVTLVVSGGGATFAMPDVTGSSEASARSQLAGLGLSVAVSYETSATAPEGTVIRQGTAAGAQVSRGAQVRLTVSGGQGLVSVPNVIGQAQGDARRALTALGFAVAVNEAYSDTAARDRVISQSPEAGSSQRGGATVALTVSMGREPVTVPDVTRRTQASAEASLRNIGLAFSISEASSDTVPRGSVISQSPAAGASASRGDSVALTVSTGRRQAQVPGVAGQTRGAASSAITTAGFTVGIEEAFHDTVAADMVISQSPAAGASAEIGSRVMLVVSRGRAQRAPTSLTLAPTALTLAVGASSQVTATVLPADATDRTVRWESSNDSVATVSSSGLVTARAAGSATITARTNTGNLTASCAVTVNANQRTITFNANGGSVNPASALTGTDGRLSSLPTPTREGRHTFNGWFLQASGGSPEHNDICAVDCERGSTSDHNATDEPNRNARASSHLYSSR
jgi:beta-lactam-binding protein with PASTA domain